jgi:hypothetical protein
MSGITITSYEWQQIEDSDRKTMIVHYHVDGREKSAPFKKLATLIEAMLREGAPASQPVNGHELA